MPLMPHTHASAARQGVSAGSLGPCAPPCMRMKGERRDYFQAPQEVAGRLLEGDSVSEKTAVEVHDVLQEHRYCQGGQQDLEAKFWCAGGLRIFKNRIQSLSYRSKPMSIQYLWVACC